jgi:hypothetical protein
MDLWDGVGTALISAVVALLTSVVLRWWDRRSVRWVVTGEAHAEYNLGKRTDRARVELDVHNAGDGDAFDVRTRRCNGGTFTPWVTLEAGKVASGESFHVTFSVSEENMDSAWVEVIARSIPVRRRPKTSRRYVLREVTGSTSDRSREDGSWGHDLPASEGGRRD